MAMQQTRDPTSKLPSASPFAGTSPPPYYHHHYGTFSPPAPPPPVAAAAYDPSLKGRSAQGVVAFPCTIQQQVFVEGLPVLEPRLPFCGVGVGWALFLLGFFLAAIPWYIGAFLLFFVALDHREKPGLIVCTVAFVSNGTSTMACRNRKFASLDLNVTRRVVPKKLGQLNC
ncbi:unnamed protein product [Triticum turgidum subsp. durum]|uniref:60S ribosomal protein L18a-like protein n=1 Tax=Triticum turgidum subsp. durum TaxID=4567 RepID=A0A9R1C1U1_TRITD|nr:unnamed protein product [Triticum turgidum subsp. durum]